MSNFVGSNTNVADTSLVYIDSLLWGSRWQIENDNRKLTYSFIDNQAWDLFILSVEEIAFDNAIASWANVANFQLEFAGYNDYSAEIIFHSVNSAAINNFLGIAAPPGENFSIGEINLLEGEVLVNWQQYLYNPSAALVVGSYDYITYVHEIGHALGLAHPHDQGGNSELFPGVDHSQDDGDYHLNQFLLTVMSYVDTISTYSPNYAANWGFVSGPMAFDIAAIQHLYGANNTHNIGNDTYYLPTANGVGTYWSCIWDAGGVDVISGEAATESITINLNQASLQYGDPNAGGYISRMDNIKGGFTIANGVTIENAIGGDGSDRLIGNGADNHLEGGYGNDTLVGGGGNDTLNGGLATDTVTFSGSRNQYHISHSSNNSIVVSDSVGDRGGIDVLTNVENLSFADDVYSITAALNNLSFQIEKNSTIYFPTETLKVKNGWIYDAEKAGLSYIDFWVSDGNHWYDIADVNNFSLWSHDRNWAEFDYQIDLREYQSASYTLWGKAYYDNGQTSNSYTTEFTVRTNSAPEKLQFQTNKTSYSQGETVSLTDAWVYDDDTAEDLDKVDFWIRRADGSWDNLYDATQCNAWNSDSRWANFDYQFDLGSYKPGTYQVWGQGYDLSGAVSNQAIAEFTITGSGTGGASVKLIDPLTAGGNNIYILGDENATNFDGAGEDDYGIIRGFDSTSDLIQLAGDITDYYTASTSSATGIYNHNDDLIAIVEGVDSLPNLSFSFV